MPFNSSEANSTTLTPKWEEISSGIEKKHVRHVKTMQADQRLLNWIDGPEQGTSSTMPYVATFILLSIIATCLFISC